MPALAPHYEKMRAAKLDDPTGSSDVANATWPCHVVTSSLTRLISTREDSVQVVQECLSAARLRAAVHE